MIWLTSEFPRSSLDLRQTGEGDLGLGSYELELLGLRNDALEGGRIGPRRLIGQVPELRRKCYVNIAPFDGEIFGVFLIHLGSLVASATALMAFCASAPALSVRTTEAFAIVS
jgi:hypothetical protein